MSTREDPIPTEYGAGPGHSGEEKNLLPLPGTKPTHNTTPDSTIVQRPQLPAGILC